MAASTHPKFGVKYGWQLGEDGWNTGMDNNLKSFALFTQFCFEEITSTPPGSPAEFDTYIVGDSPSGVWAGQAGKIAVYENSAWTFYVSAVGYAGVNKADGHLYRYYGGAWEVYRPPGTESVRVGVSAVGGMTDSEVLAIVSFPTAVTLPQNLAGSAGFADTAPGASTQIAIEHNGVQIGTVNFGAGIQTATFTLASDTAVAVGDRLVFKAPASADTTIKDVSITLLAQL